MHTNAKLPNNIIKHNHPIYNIITTMENSKMHIVCLPSSILADCESTTCENPLKNSPLEVQTKVVLLLLTVGIWIIISELNLMQQLHENDLQRISNTPCSIFKKYGHKCANVHLHT